MMLYAVNSHTQGTPPLAGFYSKAFLFFAALSSSLSLLAVIGVLTSMISW